MPPAGFEPATASAAELAFYGYQRPTEPSATASWDSAHSRLYWPTPDPYVLIFTNTVPAGADTGWSGYWSGTGGFSTVDASWTEPSLSKCTNGLAYIWAGVGGVGTNLAQDGFQIGTASNGNLYNNEAWWEFAPQEAPSPTNPTLYISPGQLAEASVLYKGSNVWQFDIADDSTGSSRIFNETQPGTPSFASAEGILERPTTSLSLPDFGSVTFNVSANYEPLGNYPPLTKDWLDGTGGDTLDNVSNISGNSFTITDTGNCT